MKKGDRVKHRSFKWLKTIGTIIDIEESFHVPFLTASVFLDARYKVKWDNEKFGESGWINESDLEQVRRYKV